MTGTNKEKTYKVFFDLMVESGDDIYTPYCSSLMTEMSDISDISAAGIMNRIIENPDMFFNHIKTCATARMECQIEQHDHKSVPGMNHNILKVCYSYRYVYYEQYFIITNIHVV